MKSKSPFTELLKNEKLTKDTYLFSIEHTRISEEQLYFKFEVFNHLKNSVFKFKIQIDVNENTKKLKIGKTEVKVGLVSVSGKNFFQLFKDGVESAIGEGRIPFIPLT